jgi:hypothetical protein
MQAFLDLFELAMQLSDHIQLEVVVGDLPTAKLHCILH